MKNEIFNVRFATLAVLLREIASLYVAPPPTPRTFRTWLNRNRVPRKKANPMARAGGGEVYYSVPDTIKMLERSFR